MSSKLRLLPLLAAMFMLFGCDEEENSPPTAVDDSYEVDQDQTLTVDAPGVLLNDTDSDGDSLTTGIELDSFNGTLVLNADGSFVYTPSAGFLGTDVFQYHAYDGEDMSNTVTVRITVVVPVNDPPTAVADSYSVDENQVLTEVVPGVLLNDTDPESQPLTADLVSDVSQGSLVLNADGSFTYTPVADYFGDDSFTYRAYDGEFYSSSVVVSLTVNEVPNVAPLVVGDSYSVDQDQVLTVVAPGVLSNDTDPESQPLTAELETDVSNGTLVLNSDGSFTYTPTTGYFGSDSFTYRANDGEDVSNIATVNLIVDEVPNLLPVVVVDSYTLDQDTVFIEAVPGVLLNDTDPESQPLTAGLVLDVSNGSLTLNADGSFTYTPNIGYWGSDSFTYKASDGEMYSDAASVALTVNSSGPAIRILSAPSFGSTGNLTGEVGGVNPADYRVFVIIFVEGAGWWLKPLTAAPLTTINPDLTWSCNVVTGGNDHLATKFMAFLVPSTYTPSAVAGLVEPPAELLAFPYAELDRHGRLISWAGKSWIVKRADYPVGPGTNRFSDSVDNVWVDVDGKLHLKIRQIGSFWYASEIISEESFGRGKYVFYLSTRAEDIDTNAVLGMFTWNNDSAYHHREIDVEISRWGNPSDDNTQFVVQPWDTTGNRYRFDMPTVIDQSSHIFDWRASSVVFMSLFGHMNTPSTGADVIEQWVYSGSDIPEPGDENVRINLWLMDTAPLGGTDVEVVLDSFEFLQIPNGTPSAVADSYTVAQDGTLSETAPGVLSNDTDPDLDPLSAVLVTDVSNGALTLNVDGSFTYTPTAGYWGSDSFTYKANDGGLDSGIVTVDITVQPSGPAIKYTYVPPYGSFNNLQGLAGGVVFADYRVATYIYVVEGGGWWTKPYDTARVRTINTNGIWTCDITTGGSDQNATKIASFLVPSSYTPPLMAGGGTLPVGLYVYANVEVTRNP